MVALLPLVVLLVYGSGLRAQACGTKVAGGAIEDQVWTAESSPYCITGDLIVGLLTIQPGVTVLFEGDFVLEVGGALKAVGMEEKPIVFTKSEGTNGWGGIFFNHSPPGSSLVHCVVEQARRGGIRIENSTPEIRSCLVQENTVDRLSGELVGAGIHASAISDGELVIEDCQILKNQGTFRPNSATFPSTVAGGGGVFAEGNVTLQRCVIAGNGSLVTCVQGAGCLLAGGGDFYTEGGGIYARGKVSLKNCEVRKNRSESEGDGILMQGHSVGGGLFFESGELQLVNSIFACNESVASCNCFGATPLAGGLFFSSGTVSIENCTIARNMNEGLRNSGGTATVRNSIVYFNSGVQVAGALDITYCDVQGGHDGEGNIDFSPAFEGQDCENLKILPGSRCIDAGDINPTYDDACRPPARGTERNDMGAHGGPGGCCWAPGSCEVGGVGPFVRGDCNGDGDVAGTADAIFLLFYNFSGGAQPKCFAACDADADGRFSGVVTDAVYLLSYLFLGTKPPPPAPFPSCGSSTRDTDKSLGCNTPMTKCP